VLELKWLTYAYRPGAPVETLTDLVVEPAAPDAKRV
jgi:hypothetical protein